MNIILSIHPKWAKLIYEGKKTIEWRKSRPKLDRNNRHTRVYIYETAPVKRITGHFTLFGTFAVDVNGMLEPPVSGGRNSMTFKFVRAMLDDMEKNGRVPAGDLAKYQGDAKAYGRARYIAHKKHYKTLQKKYYDTHKEHYKLLAKQKRLMKKLED